MAELTLPEIIIGLAGSSGITQLGNWIASRTKNKAYTMGAVDHAVQTAMASVTGQLERTEHRLEAVEGQHAECEIKLRDLGGRLDDSERERAALRAEIHRLMAGPVADYTQDAPK